MDNEICRDLRLQVLSDRRPSWRSSPNLRIFPSTRISPAVDTDPISTTLTSRGRVISRTSALVLSLLCKSSAIRPIDRQVVVRRGSGRGDVANDKGEGRHPRDTALSSFPCISSTSWELFSLEVICILATVILSVPPHPLNRH